ncbi:DUF1992 domain-containing protein [Fundidesulfovibrio butyratiphilus]
MFAAIAYIAEQRILEAMEKGEFDNLPGKGKPLDLDDDANVPEDLRMAYKLLKNAGYAPEELAKETGVKTTRDLLPKDTGERKRLRQLQKMEILFTKAGFGAKRMESLEANADYFDALVSRVPVRDTEEKS